MATTVTNTFPQFSLLPAEIQLQIWESTPVTLPTRQMHIFDIHTPPAPAPAPVPPTGTPTTAPRKPAAPTPHAHRRTRSQSPGRNFKSNTTTSTKRIRKSSSSSCSPPCRHRRNATSLSTLPTATLAPFNASGNSSFDPSAYQLRNILRATCHTAATTIHRTETRIPPADRATVELPSGRRLVYNNALDVLHLRFLGGGGNDSSSSHDQNEGVAPASAPAPPLTALFQSLWSPALATALHAARRVAIDVSQIWPELADQQQKLVQDIVFLVCTLQNDLEVLYLVDYAAQEQGMGGAGAAEKNLASSSSNRGSELYARFHSYGRPDQDAEKEMERSADVIHGNGMVWREVFDLESLGWHERHPGFVFGEMFGEVVRLQQGQWFGEGEKKATFQGVRVMLAENEIAEEVNGDHMDES